MLKYSVMPKFQIGGSCRQLHYSPFNDFKDFPLLRLKYCRNKQRLSCKTVLLEPASEALRVDCFLLSTECISFKVHFPFIFLPTLLRTVHMAASVYSHLGLSIQRNWILLQLLLSESSSFRKLQSWGVVAIFKQTHPSILMKIHLQISTIPKQPCLYIYIHNST